MTQRVAVWVRAGRCFLLACSVLLSACVTGGVGGAKLAQMPPLQLQDRRVEISEVAALAPTPELLHTDDAMLDFVARYTGDIGSERQRLLSLHRAIRGRATLGIDYDPAAQGTASEAFHAQTANCLSYANLFIALAREAGLDARYQWLDVRPQWTRMGERVAVRLHVNAVVHLSARDRFMVDLDPLPSRDITDAREISDRDAQALYHSNVAMDALADEQLQQAWANAMRALQLSPEMPHLWVNLGVVYRRSAQYDAAETAYLAALGLDSHERSAMNNLTVLYELQGRHEERDYWQARVERHRDGNPYYHAWLGDQAAEEGDWRGALGHYRQALSLAPEDAGLLFSVGLIYRELGEPRAALRYVGRAREQASLMSEKQSYEATWLELTRQLAASR
ncbi:tetratricopeptide repeat protein [Pseudohalioglobus sediminis]|uniref:Tetratricopeptide repeat protein n=1 Tax=Pseudohalioglobus sediminis TaxID=2606449 RepID=A0A5B0WQC3_9GAMM|nr:transglutaminase-like domain-containing protein [Pseudohalioglobus sediminis]KAA1188986.1 tetratricopeptide repeat protein [Pseudohalioglobus sediminis]